MIVARHHDDIRDPVQRKARHIHLVVKTRLHIRDDYLVAVQQSRFKNFQDSQIFVLILQPFPRLRVDVLHQGVWMIEELSYECTQETSPVDDIVVAHVRRTLHRVLLQNLKEIVKNVISDELIQLFFRLILEILRSQFPTSHFSGENLGQRVRTEIVVIRLFFVLQNQQVTKDVPSLFFFGFRLGGRLRGGYGRRFRRRCRRSRHSRSLYCDIIALFRDGIPFNTQSKQKNRKDKEQHHEEPGADVCSILLRRTRSGSHVAVKETQVNKHHAKSQSSHRPSDGRQ